MLSNIYETLYCHLLEYQWPNDNLKSLIRACIFDIKSAFPHALDSNIVMHFALEHSITR